VQRADLQVVRAATPATTWDDAIAHACDGIGAVRPVFQPIVDIRRGVPAGYEGLARFNGPPDAPPDRWFAEAYVRGIDLEARTLSVMLAARDRLPVNCFLSVNCGPDALLDEKVQRVFARRGDLRGLVIEVTEQAEVADYDTLSAALERLRSAGASIAVDDAGAGFASLQHVVRLRPDFVKVDRGLVAGVDTDGARAAVVETLGHFAARLDAWLVAEGVETELELHRLAGLGVPLAQGWHLGRPAADFGASSAELAAAQASAERHATLRPLESLAEPDRSAVVLDEFGRASAMADGTAPLCVAGSAGLAEVAARAMARPERERFSALVVTDERGRYVGILRIERLVEALARLGSDA
jgi:EAL domain-containing protein (putative c-di-GMP-specific phosphodiesterase class I)